jgi:D-beta-D-heptose 7-phosphate kinase/D-beta-D-heptose 1-phosphate adenosyltransferase
MSNSAPFKKYDIVIVSGAFDPVHTGHVDMLKEASKIAHSVVVGVNSDDWLIRKKGRFYLPLEDRMEIMAAMRYVTQVRNFDDEDGTACDLIQSVVDSVTYQNNQRFLEVAFANGGSVTTIDKRETDLCKKLDVALEWDLGGPKTRSSRQIIINAHGESFFEGDRLVNVTHNLD